MSGRYENKKANKHRFPWVSVVIILVVGCIVLLLHSIFAGQEHHTGNDSNAPSASDTVTPETTDIPTTDIPENTDEATIPEEEYLLSLDSNIKIIEICSYSGPYNEDGSDDAVENVMRILVKNIGDEPLQYAKFTLTGDTTEAAFTLTTLLPGESAYVLEANRKNYSENDVYSAVKADNVAYFMYEPTVYADMFQIQPLDGGFNIKSISGEDIDGKIVIYFKDYDGEVYIGGITYSGTIKDGMKAGETKQIMSENFTASNTKIVFINIG